MPTLPRAVVVGAGAFGGWCALHLARRGWRVTLVDAWGPGNSRSSSGGETRVLRSVYGADPLYVEWVERSRGAWEDLGAERRQRLLVPTGCLWLVSGGDEAYLQGSLPVLERAGVRFEPLRLAEARERFEWVSFDGVETVFWEPGAGYLLARRACAEVAAALREAGGEVRRGWAVPGPMEGGRMRSVDLADGSRLAADAFVFACGPWLGEIFPQEVGRRILPSRQEVFYFGAPADLAGRDLPVWVDLGERVWYGIPDGDHRGFKLADDTRGEPFDPTAGDRTYSPEALSAARRFLARRFPGLAQAPLVEHRVCQYENSPDGDLYLDRHPEAANVWLAGGGSGHGFKLAPAVGEHVADLIVGEAQPLARFSLSRLLPGEGRRSQWGRQIEA